MATLRDSIGIRTSTGLADEIQDANIAAGMGSLRRGFNAGRLGTELNPKRTELLDAEIAGDEAEAAPLRGEIARLERRQALYAPKVGRLEDVGGVGDALDYAAGQVGQGAASMIDPVAVSAGLNAAGTGVSMIPSPLAKVAGAGLRGAGMVVPALMSKQQLTGEFIGDAQGDEALMARTSPQALRDMAGNYGTLAAVPDSFLPGLVGRQLGGAGLRKGISAVGAAPKALGGTLMEGVTEAGQQAGSQFAQGLLNPERDTSGDFMENVNAFAGGALGGGPFAAAGAAADAGFRRTGVVADALGTKAGETLDLLGEKLGPVAGKVKGKTIDLLADEDGKVSLQGLNDKLRASAEGLVSRGRLDDDEMAVLSDVPPEDILADDARASEWINANGPRRSALVVEKLRAMAEDDAQAADLINRAAAEQDPERQQLVIDEGAQLILASTPRGRAESRAEKLTTLAGAAGSLLGKAGVALGKGAVSLGKATMDGVKDGMAKKNAQANEDFAAWRERTYGVSGKPAAVLVAGGPDFNERAELAAGYADDMAKRARFNIKGGQALARQTVFNLADMVDSGGTDVAKLTHRLNRITADLADIYKDRAPEVLRQLGGILGADSGPIIKHMATELEQQLSPSGRAYIKDARAALAEQVVNLIGVPEQAALMKEGINLREPKQATELLGLLEDFADGIGAAPGMRKALDQRFGKAGVDQILELLNGLDEKLSPGDVVDDRSQIEGEGGEFEQEQQEKNVARGSGPKLYGFHATANMRTNSESRDAFAPTRETGDDGVVQRPALFKKGQQLFGGKGDAIEKKVADMRKQLQEDPDYPDHDNYDVAPRAAWDVMKDANTQPGKVVQLFRDYQRMEAQDAKLTPEERAAASRLGRLANLMLADGEFGGIGKNAEGGLTETQAAGSGIATSKAKKDMKTTPGERIEVADAAKAYFSERFIVVAEQLSNRDPSKIAITELLDMHKVGQQAMERARTAEDVAKAVSGANLLVFKSDAVKGGEVTIPAGKLVSWVRQQRKDDEPADLKNASKDEAYLTDVSEGIAALIGSGFVKGMPYKLNDQGQAEHFNKGIPPSLRLATKTFAGMTYAAEQRRAARDGDTITNPDPEAVAEDQARNEQEFVADPLEVVEPGPKGERRFERELEINAQGLRVDRSGRRNPEPLTSDDNKTPLDFFPKQKAGAVPDEFADQQFLTRMTNSRFEGGPEPKMTAVGQARFRAEALMAEFSRDPEAFTEKVMSRLRSAKRPAYAPGDQQVSGGAHYIAPIAYLVQRDRTAGMGLGQTEQEMFDFLRREAAQVLLNAPETELSKTQMLNIAQMMSTDPRKVNTGNVRGMLEKLAARETQPVVAKPEPAAPKAGIMSRAIAQRMEFLNNPPADYTTAKAKEIGAWAQTQLDRIKQELPKAEGDRAAALEDYQVSLRQMAKKVASVVEGDESLAGFEGTASEVAAGAPKGRVTLSGGSEGRKLNAQDAPDGKRMAAAQRVDDLTGRMNRRQEEADIEWRKVRSLEAKVAAGKANQELLDSIREQAEYLQARADEVKPELEAAERELEGRMLNAQGGPTASASHIATQAEMDEAKAYAAKVLGPKIKVEFKNITGYSGEFIDATNTIEISTTAAAGTLGTLYHEAMHVFFRDFVKGNPALQRVFGNLVNDPRHMARLQALLKDYPAALAQLTSGEERLAYTYQFWKAGLLPVDATAKTILQKVGKFFRRVFNMTRDSERAVELFIAFDNGRMSEPSAAGKVIVKALGQGGTAKLRRNLDGVVQGLAAMTMPASEILGNSDSPTARKLSTMFFTNPGEESHGSEERGLLNARRSVAKQYTNLVNRIMEDLTEADQTAVQRYLQNETDPKTIALDSHREAVKGIRAALDRFHKYMTEAGLKIGKVDNYYPVVWNTQALLDKKAEFLTMLTTKYAAELKPADGNIDKAAERIWQSLVDKDGVDAHLPASREDGVLTPFFASQGMRTLPWIKGADREAFLDKNMPMTLSRYFNQGAHSAEYFRRFGEGGEKLDDMIWGTKTQVQVAGKWVDTRKDDGIVHELGKVGKQMVADGKLANEAARRKWLSRQMRDVAKSIGAMEGSLGKDVSPTMRSFNSWMMAYQNIRLLPMSLFSSFVDPLALVARGAPLSAAYETFMRGVREVFRTWGDAFRDMPAERQRDEWEELAEHIGATEVAMFSHHTAEEYSSTYMTPGAKKLNDKLFVLNGMEAWNRASRVMATKWAVRFIEKHVGLPDKIHSARWLRELGLTPADITLDAGKLVTDRHQLATLKNIPIEQATKEIGKIHDALNRWVEGAVLTPNAAQRPAWASDPHYATFFHLKQFSYSFHQTILKRAVNEFKHGNMAPVGSLAMFIPTMITADVMKGLIQGGGELPAHMKGMNVGDWFAHGAQRAGLLGIGNIGMDAEVDPMSLGGPAVEQISDGLRDGFGEKTMLKAMPLNSLYGEIFRGSTSAP